jgi:hypothetical protein
MQNNSTFPTARFSFLSRRPLRAAAVGFSLAWIAGLSVPVPLVDVDAPASAAAAALSGHEGELALQSLFVHGLAAAAIVVITLAVARALGQGLAGRVARGAGLAAAGISVLQCALELTFAGTSDGSLIEAVNRLDGVKMVTLGVLALAGSTAVALPRWLRALGPVLAVAIFVSAAGYGLLMPALAPAAYVSLPLLLVWMTASGLALSRR